MLDNRIEKLRNYVMEDKLIRKIFDKMKEELSKTEKCPDENDLVRFAEGIMDEKEVASIEEHLALCPKCCDYVISLNKVMNFSEEENLPEVPDEQMRKAIGLVEERGGHIRSKGVRIELEQIAQSIKDFFSFNWLAQPIPVAVRSGAMALIVLLIVSTTYLYYRTPSLGLQMEVVGKTSVIPTMRGKPEEEPVEKIIKEGDTLYSNDYCRINFELEQDAYAYVLYYDSTGKLNQLYPDPAIETPHKVKGNTKHTIPKEDENWFELDNHVGTETIFVLASKKPISDFKETFNAVKGTSKEKMVETFKSKASVVKILSFKHQ